MINKISEETRQKIIAKSVHPLPDNPSQSGYKAGAIKGSMHRYATDLDTSIIAEINRIVGEIEDEFGVAFMELEPLADFDNVQDKRNGYIPNVGAGVTNNPLGEDCAYYQFVIAEDRIAQVVIGTILAYRVGNVKWHKAVDRAELAASIGAVKITIENIVTNITKIANEDGGASIGENTQATTGGAIGQGSKTQSGGAVGQLAKTSKGGAVGQSAETTDGGAIGQGAYAHRGGAVGYNARTWNGFAGGENANADGGYYKVQLGSGYNPEDNTFYFGNANGNHKIVDADGTLVSGGKKVATEEDVANTYVPKKQKADINTEGIIQIANDEDVLLGTDDSKAITSKKLKNAIDKRFAEWELFKIVKVLPAKGEPNILYLLIVPPNGNNTFDEYLWVNQSWEPVGSAKIDIDLSAYMPRDEISDKYDIIDLGSIPDGIEFNIDADKVLAMFNPQPKDVTFKWSNWQCDLGRHDRKIGGDKVYYSSSMDLDGTNYRYALIVDKSTNKGMLERIEDKNFVNLGDHNLKDGATFSITLDNAGKRNVAYVYVNDTSLTADGNVTTRYFHKNRIIRSASGDIIKATFSEMWGNSKGELELEVSSRLATYHEVVLADKDTASAMANRLKFNQLLDTATSTLPTANGLTITNIYGGHHVAGTTDHQYYHKMYDIGTISGHWYYFAPNFSDTKSVYILGHIDGTAFSTNKGKVFEGGIKFDAYIQIEKEKTMDFDVQPILVDLTEMFGAGNEPASVDEMYKYIAKGTYYPYDRITDLVAKGNESWGMALDPTNFVENIIAGWGADKPSVEYVAPANGWVMLSVLSTNSTAVNIIYNNRQQLYIKDSFNGYNWHYRMLPISKGDKLILEANQPQNIDHVSYTKFFYAKKVVM